MAKYLTAVLFIALIAGTRGAAPQCERLTSLSLPNATITLAQTVPAGTVEPSFTAPAAFCRVAATLKPAADSDIKIEVWMPLEGWNGKFQAVGNGAFSGAIAYGAMRTALERGYATASTDTGHTGNTASFAPGHPEKVVDFGWRAAHEMTMAAKRIVTAHYEKAPRYSYWNGCSAGGRQAMQEAQRFPADFDGIIAGAPGIDWTGRAGQALRVAKALETSEPARLPQSARVLLHDAAVRGCDASDGVKDGLIGDPERCRFDPAVLQCASESATGCLSPAQVETARLIYSSATNPKSGREVAGLLPGSELGWTDLGWTASARATGLDQFRFIVFADPAWTVARFDFGADMARADTVDGGTINALDPDLKPFFDRGGKLIQYHGWSDPQISPSNSTQYYRRVLEALAGKADVPASHRLFMAPGMGHCGGGEGPSTFDMLAALERWVEQRQAPDQIPASHSTNGRIDRTRPLCPFPRVATYKGSGSTDEAANFVCRSS
jgi:feruloyl esterase